MFGQLMFGWDLVWDLNVLTFDSKLEWKDLRKACDL